MRPEEYQTYEGGEREPQQAETARGSLPSAAGGPYPQGGERNGTHGSDARGRGPDGGGAAPENHAPPRQATDSGAQPTAGDESHSTGERGETLPRRWPGDPAPGAGAAGPGYPPGPGVPGYGRPDAAGGRHGYPGFGRRRRRMRGGIIRIRRPVLIGGAVLLAVLCVLATLLLIPRPKRPAEGTFLTQAMGVPVQTVLIPAGTDARPGTKREIRYVVIHETGNPAEGADARSHSDYLQDGGERGVSWHYTVDDHEIYHHLPDDEIGWHASSEEGNRYGIGVELCVNADGDFEKTFDNGARLTATLLYTYGLSVGDVKQHGDFTDKNCPQTIRDTGRWDAFKDLVREYLAELKKDG